MISIVFKKMEHHSGDFSESLKRLNTGESLPGQDSSRGANELASAGAGTATQGSGRRSSQAGVRPQRPVGQPAQREGADQIPSSERQGGAGGQSGRDGPARGQDEGKGDEGSSVAGSNE
jgi:hypothetical protein